MSDSLPNSGDESESEALQHRKELREKASMTYWWRKLAPLDVPTPDTCRLEVYPAEIDGVTVYRPKKEEVFHAVSDVGGPPAFFRSDQMSAKHRMEDGSKIASRDDEALISSIVEVSERNMMAMGVPQPEAYYVREWLDLYHEYTAFRGTPIAAELRVFIHDGEVKQHGFYWPEDAIRRPDTPNWEDMHAEVREAATNPTRAEAAEKYAQRVAEAFDGYWSVDFALTTNDQWYAIDMAPGELSWHPESCEQLRTVEGSA